MTLEMPDLNELFSDTDKMNTLLDAQNAVNLESIDLGI